MWAKLAEIQAGSVSAQKKKLAIAPAANMEDFSAMFFDDFNFEAFGEELQEAAAESSSSLPSQVSAQLKKISRAICASEKFTSKCHHEI